jgi:tetratricopeptide (TPR) repeat protein
MVSLAGCSSVSGFSPLGEQISASLPNDETGLRRYAEELGRRYDANPADRQTVLIYAAVLRKLGQTAQAVALLQREAASNPEDLDVLGAYGKALADVGRYQEAAEVLSRAYGQTNMIALDTRGQALAEVMLVVKNAEFGLVVQRGLERETWTCSPRCEPAISPGDSARHTGEAIKQAGQHGGCARPNAPAAK